MKPLWINRKGTITKGVLNGHSGRVVAFDSELDEAIIQLDKNTSVTISSDFVEQPKELAVPWIHNRCIRCGRKLMSEESKELGYGPTCLKKINDTTKAAQMMIDEFMEG